MEALVTGAGGFIGGHLVRRLLEDGHKVIAFDDKPVQDWWQHHREANSVMMDLRHHFPFDLLTDVDTVFHLAANMGGIEFIEQNKLACAMSTRIDLNLLDWATDAPSLDRLFYASSACVYPAYKQDNPLVRPLKESDVYPADAEDGYGWQKLYTERLLRHVDEETFLDVRIARFHNVYGPRGTWQGGREKAPAALCRKIAEAILFGRHYIEMYGDGEQTRSFMHVDDCVEGIIRITESGFSTPFNLGSEEMVTLNQLAHYIMRIAGVELEIKHIENMPEGVRGRSSDNSYIRETLHWEPSIPLARGLIDTYTWIFDRVSESHA